MCDDCNDVASRRSRRACEDELSLSDSLQPAQFRRHFLQRRRLATEDDYLQAVVVVEVDVHRRNHHVGVSMLQFQQFICQVRAVVIVDEGQCRGGVLGVGSPGVAGQRLAQQLPDRLAARCEAAFLAVAVELFQQLGFQRYRKTHQVRHDCLPPHSAARAT